MELFCSVIRRDSVFLLRFPFLRHVRVFSHEILLVCRLNYTNSYFFLVIFLLLMLKMSVLFLVAVISLPPRFFILCSSRYIDASTLSSTLASPLSPCFLDTYSLSTSSLGYKALCIVMGFLILWSIYRNFSLVLFKNGPKYLTKVTAQVFIPLMRSLQCSF